MTRVADFEVDADQPLEPNAILAIEAKVMLDREIRDAMDDLSQRLWQSVHWAVAPSNRRAAEIISQQWQEWMPVLLSDQEEVDIDLTAFVDEPDVGHAGAHMMPLLGLLALLSNRGGGWWRDRWKKGKPWAARFGLRREET